MPMPVEDLDPLHVAEDIIRSDDMRDSASWGTAAHAQALATIAVAWELRAIRKAQAKAARR